MKRIALVHSEFLQAGMPAALHVNGRTDRDFERWGEFIASREEITHVAYEFSTPGGRERHATWLCGLGEAVSRPLHLVARGGFDLLPRLACAFAQVSVLETESFMRTMKRRRAELQSDGQLAWRAAPSEKGAPLDGLLEANSAAVRRAIEARCAPQVTTGRG